MRCRRYVMGLAPGDRLACRFGVETAVHQGPNVQVLERATDNKATGGDLACEGMVGLIALYG